MIKDYREKQYQKNCELIDMILEHRNAESITERVEQVVCEELELNVNDFLSAYQDGDPDAMVCLCCRLQEVEAGGHHLHDGLPYRLPHERPCVGNKNT